MKEMTHFSPEVCEKIEYYVYRLIDPRNGQTFYVGKGKGNRVFAHVHDALKLYDGVNYQDEEDKRSIISSRIQRSQRITMRSGAPT